MSPHGVVMLALLIGSLSFTSCINAKSHGEVLQCLHEEVKQCRIECLDSVDSSRKESVGSCLRDEIDLIRREMRECLANKNVQLTQDCFLMDFEQKFQNIATASFQRLDDNLQIVMNSTAHCGGSCLANRKPQMIECQSNCTTASDEIRTNVQQCSTIELNKLPHRAFIGCLHFAFDIPQRSLI